MPRVHSRPFDLQEIEWPLVRSCHPPDMFRPCRSYRLRRFSPHRHPAGLLHPATDHGVRPVFNSEPPSPASGHGRSGLSPGTQHPSELSPRLQPYRVTAAVAFSPFGAPWSRKRSVAEPDSIPLACRRPQGFAPQPSPLPRPVFPPGRRPMLPWASAPPGSQRPVRVALRRGHVQTAELSFPREGRSRWFERIAVHEGSGSAAGRNQSHTPPSSRFLAK
jgi:hypothetical protein